MANNIWDNSDADNDGNNANNWSLGWVPKAGDVAYFDNTSDANCTFSGNVSCDGLDATTDYDGDIDFGDGLSHTWGSDGFYLRGTGAWDLGANTTHNITDATVYINHTNQVAETATLRLNGTCSLTGSPSCRVNRLWIESGTTTGKLGAIYDRLDVEGTFVVTQRTRARSDCEVRVPSSGAITVNSSGFDGTFALYLPNAGKGIVQLDGTIDGSGRMEIQVVGSGFTLLAGSYMQSGSIIILPRGSAGSLGFSGSYSLGHVELWNNNSGTGHLTITEANGTTVTIGGDLTVDLDSTANIILNPGTNGLIVQGDIVDEITGGGSFVANSCPLTLSGTSDQDIDGCGGTWGDIEIDKSAGKVTCSSTLTCSTFTGTDGTFDPNGQTVAASGNVSWAAAFTFVTDADAFNGCTWTVGGNFTADGQTLKATAGWTLTVTGTAIASSVGAVAYSDASGGTEIDATAGPWVDNGNNTNWAFSAGNPWYAFQQQIG